MKALSFRKNKSPEDVQWLSAQSSKKSSTAQKLMSPCSIKLGRNAKHQYSNLEAREGITRNRTASLSRSTTTRDTGTSGLSRRTGSDIPKNIITLAGDRYVSEGRDGPEPESEASTYAFPRALTFDFAQSFPLTSPFANGGPLNVFADHTPQSAKTEWGVKPTQSDDDDDEDDLQENKAPTNGDASSQVVSEARDQPEIDPSPSPLSRGLTFDFTQNFRWNSPFHQANEVDEEDELVTEEATMARYGIKSLENPLPPANPGKDDAEIKKPDDADTKKTTDTNIAASDNERVESSQPFVSVENGIDPVKMKKKKNFRKKAVKGLSKTAPVTSPKNKADPEQKGVESSSQPVAQSKKTIKGLSKKASVTSPKNEADPEKPKLDPMKLKKKLSFRQKRATELSCKAINEEAELENELEDDLFQQVDKQDIVPKNPAMVRTTSELTSFGFEAANVEASSDVDVILTHPVDKMLETKTETKREKKSQEPLVEMIARVVLDEDDEKKKEDEAKKDERMVSKFDTKSPRVDPTDEVLLGKIINIAEENKTSKFDYIFEDLEEILGLEEEIVGLEEGIIGLEETKGTGKIKEKSKSNGNEVSKKKTKRRKTTTKKKSTKENDEAAKAIKASVEKKFNAAASFMNNAFTKAATYTGDEILGNDVLVNPEEGESPGNNSNLDKDVNPEEDGIPEENLNTDGAAVEESAESGENEFSTLISDAFTRASTYVSDWTGQNPMPSSSTPAEDETERAALPQDVAEPIKTSKPDGVCSTDAKLTDSDPVSMDSSIHSTDSTVEADRQDKNLREVREVMKKIAEQEEKLAVAKSKFEKASCCKTLNDLQHELAQVAKKHDKSLDIEADDSEAEDLEASDDSEVEDSESDSEEDDSSVDSEVSDIEDCDASEDGDIDVSDIEDCDASEDGLSLTGSADDNAWPAWAAWGTHA